MTQDRLTAEGVDKFLYYRLLNEIVWGRSYDKILHTTAWHGLDKVATHEQKQAALTEARRLSLNVEIRKTVPS